MFDFVPFCVILNNNADPIDRIPGGGGMINIQAPLVSQYTVFMNSLNIEQQLNMATPIADREKKTGPPRRAIIAVTSAHAPLYPDGKETGLFITEALHPFNVFKKHGFEVDLVSETGSYQADWLSQQKEWLPDEDRKVWEDTNSEFRKKLDAGLRPGDFNPDNYGIFFASAGHASLIDYPEAKGLQTMAAKMYGDGAIISAVCHGGAIFPGIISPLTDQSIISGRKVTGFTTKGEEEEGVLDTIKSWNRPTIEKSAADAGATYVAPPGPWDSFTQTDDRIVTGANPASAEATAVAAVKAFEELTKIPRLDHDYKGDGTSYREKGQNALDG